MANKAIFSVITIFWLTMNALLWRAEFSGRDDGAEVPVPLVWEKILRSPDDSALAVSFEGKRVGYIRWIPNIGEESSTGKTANENTEIEGRIKDLQGYTIRSEGNFILPEDAGRLRFEYDGKFDAENQWSAWAFKGLQRPQSWQVSANRKTETMEFSLGDGKEAVTQKLPFSAFRDPGKLLDAAGATAQLPALAAALPSLNSASGTNAFSLGLKWVAHQDWLKMGHSRVRVYNLRARILDQYEIFIVVSKVGEILRVELPGDMTLVNEALINL